MDKLPYPYIRRKRRSLIIEDAPPIPTKTAPVQPVVNAPEVEPAKISKPDDAENTSSTAAP
jgi:hypothetical protein